MSCDIAGNLRLIRDRIEKAALRSGRDPKNIKLVAISKTQPASAVQAAFESGQLLFGESYVQEAKQKIDELQLAAREHIQFHLVGHLQRNKVKHAVKLFDVIQSVDNLALAETISEKAAGAAKVQRILLQVNLLGEEQKAGVAPDNAEQLCKDILSLQNLHLDGLMFIGRFYDSDASNAKTKSEFQQMADFHSQLSAKLGREMPELSMGMSSDFELAIECGASIVRVGSAIFGERLRA